MPPAHEIHDHYFHRAKREGYASRAAFKLIEIDDRKQILRKGDRVLDFGAAPGSWLQVAAQRVGPRGVVVGLDLKPIQLQVRAGQVHVRQGDIREVPAASLLEAAGDGNRLFDVILSDMAPYTSGEASMDHHKSIRLCDEVIARCPDLLRPGGNLVMKVFEGEAYPDLLARMRSLFDTTKGYKPAASRGASREMYVIGKGYRKPANKPISEPELPPKQPSRGWGRS